MGFQPSQQHHPDDAPLSGVPCSAADRESKTYHTRDGGTQEGVSGGGGAGGLPAEGERGEDGKTAGGKVRPEFDVHDTEVHRGRHILYLGDVSQCGTCYLWYHEWFTCYTPGRGKLF